MSVPTPPDAGRSGPQQLAPSPWGATNGPGTLWARQTTSGTQRVTSRVRRLVQGLPDWEPLPPGEVLVRRYRA